MFRTALISMFITSTALADTWTVDDNGKADFDNIQAAVVAASDGDEIIVMPGTYTSTAAEVVDMRGKEIWLHSSGGPGVTIIDGEEARRGIYCANGETLNTIIEGFMITGGYSSNGGGIYCSQSSPTITGSTISSNMATSGGGVFCINNSSPTITDSTISSNTTFFGGGGIYSRGGTCNPMVTNCTIEGNTSKNYGGGFFSHFNSSPTFSGCTISGNAATLGGGVYCESNSSPTLTGCDIANNSATQGGGIYLTVSSPTITQCMIMGNTALDFGGGVNCYYISNPVITDTVLCSNTPSHFFGSWVDNGGNTIADVCPIDCPDINGDGYVDVSDLLLVIGYWGSADSLGDINQDGIVDVLDLLILIANWGPCE